MSKTTTYTYTVLRYIHDISTGEFVNVGVALYAPETGYANAKCRHTYGRLSKVFPGINADYFKALMHNIETHFKKLGEQLGGQLSLESAQTVADLARRVLPTDDSALQWSPIGAGRTDNPVVTLDKLFDRMVMRYEDRATCERRTEDDVWRHFKGALETNQLLQYFTPKKIVVSDDEIEFEHTWKNGVLHCLQPVSFDLASRDSIRDKAHRWLGRVTSIKQSSDKLHLYFLVGQPQDKDLLEAYESALSILKKVPAEQEIFQEQQAEELSDSLAQKLADHQGMTH